YSPPLTDVGLEEQITGAAEAGFELLGLNWSVIEAYLAGGRTYSDLRHTLEDAGTEVFEFNYCSVTTDETATAHAAEATVRSGGHRGDRHTFAVFHSEIDDDLLRSFDRCCSILHREGVRAGCEFLPTSPVARIRDARRVVDAVGSERAGVLVDTWHVRG